MNALTLSLALSSLLFASNGTDTPKKPPVAPSKAEATKPAEKSAERTASLRLINYLSDKNGPFDVSIGGKSHRAPAPGSVIDLEKLTEGKVPIEVKIGEKSLFTREMTVRADATYVAVLYGTMNDPKFEFLTAPSASADKSELLIVHADPSASRLDVWVDGKALDKATGLACGKTASASIEPGKHHVELRDGKNVIASKDVDAARAKCECVFVGPDVDGKPLVATTAVAKR